MKSLPIRIRYKRVILSVMAFVGAHFGTVVVGAAIVYVPDQGFVLSEDGESREIDLGGIDRPMTFSGRHIESTGEMRWVLSSSVFHQFVRQEGSPDPMRLDAGMEIGDGLLWSNITRGDLIIASSGGALSESKPFYDTEGFMAVGVYEEEFGWEDEEALPYYGWIRVSHSAEESSLTVHDWAWNDTPGDPILAGQIPEPATYAMLVGIGALGFVVFRKRRGNASG